MYRGFNPRLPGGRRHQPGRALVHAHRVSIHAFRGEGDTERRTNRQYSTGFNPRLPGGRRRRYGNDDNDERDVSIHAFRGEGDLVVDVDIGGVRRFNPRLPGGRRPLTGHQRARETVFQSTPSGGKATAISDQLSAGSAFQSTPSGGKATYGTVNCHLRSVFQSTPSGGKATLLDRRGRAILAGFNPRLPGGRRQPNDRPTGAIAQVSIHAFRGEGDRGGVCVMHAVRGFNPRLPGGRRHGAIDWFPLGQTPFQSTPSGGKATGRWGKSRIN